MIDNPEMTGGEDRLSVPSVTPEGAFSGNEMAHFTPCGLPLVSDFIIQRVSRMRAEIDIYDRGSDGPIVVYRRTTDGSLDIACWGTGDCPGATVTVPAQDMRNPAIPETAIALHGICKQPTRTYVNGGRLTEVPYTPLP